MCEATENRGNYSKTMKRKNNNRNRNRKKRQIRPTLVLSNSYEPAAFSIKKPGHVPDDAPEIECGSKGVSE